MVRIDLTEHTLKLATRYALLPFVLGTLFGTTTVPAPVEAVDGVWRLCFCEEGAFLDGVEVDNHGYIARCVLPFRWGMRKRASDPQKHASAW